MSLQRQCSDLTLVLNCTFSNLQCKISSWHDRPWAGTRGAPSCMYAAVKSNISERSEDLLSKGTRIVLSFSVSMDQSSSSFLVAKPFSCRAFSLPCHGCFPFKSSHVFKSLLSRSTQMIHCSLQTSFTLQLKLVLLLFTLCVIIQLQKF